MSTLTPEKFLGTRCGEMVEQGMVAYRCELEQGHSQVPGDDPEPHYAVEVGRSTRAWQAWKQRQMQRDAPPSTQAIQGITCPTCGGAMILSDDGTLAVCGKNVSIGPEYCEQAPIAVAQPREVQKAEVVEGVAAGVYDQQEMDSKAYLQQRPAANGIWYDVSDMDVLNSQPEVGHAGCPRTIVHDGHHWALRGESEVYQCKGDLSDAPGPDARQMFAADNGGGDPEMADLPESSYSYSPLDEHPVASAPVNGPLTVAHRTWSTPHLQPGALPLQADCGRCAEIEGDPHPGLATWVSMVAQHFETDHAITLVNWEDEIGWVNAEPTKQREGDQALPSGGVQCVQDQIIADMEESKRVGMERYGSVLMTFNGRKGLQDVHEEVRDLHVYLTQLVMEGEATREQLEVVVASRIRPILEDFPGLGPGTIDGLASLAVDAVMGWVVAQSPDSGSTG